MADSTLWLRLGEKIGYALGAVTLGPAFLATRRLQRKIRRAFAVWCQRSLRHEKLESPRGRLRRLVTIATSGEPVEIEAELDVGERVARLLVTLPAIPGYVDAKIEISKGAEQAKEPRVTRGPIVLCGETALADDVDELFSAFERIRASSFVARMTPDQMELRLSAPEDEADWAAVASALGQVHVWATRRSGAYRS